MSSIGVDPPEERPGGGMCVKKDTFDNQFCEVLWSEPHLPNGPTSDAVAEGASTIHASIVRAYTTAPARGASTKRASQRKRALQGSPPTRKQPPRSAKRIKVEPNTPDVNRDGVPGPSPSLLESILPKPEEDIIQHLLADAKIQFVDKDEYMRTPHDKVGLRHWHNDKANWDHVHEHAHISTAILQRAKAVGGEGVAYLLQTAGPAAARHHEKVPRHKRYYIVKTISTFSIFPIPPETDGTTKELKFWLSAIAPEFRVFARLLRGQLHPNICSLEAFAGVPGTSTGLLFYEYANGGDLASLQNGYFLRKDRFPEAFIWHVSAQLADAVHWLHTGKENPAVAFPGGHKFHSRFRDHLGRASSTPQISTGAWKLAATFDKNRWEPIMHRDIKPHNIFLTWRTNDPNRLQYPDVKLGDFGMSGTEKIMKDDYRGYGTLPYGPPDNAVTCAMDVWAIGAVIHSLGHNGFPPVREREINFQHAAPATADAEPAQGSKQEANDATAVPANGIGNSGEVALGEDALDEEASDEEASSDEVFPNEPLLPVYYKGQDDPAWVDGNIHWGDKMSAVFDDSVRLLKEGRVNYQIHPLPGCYSEALDSIMKWILDFDEYRRPPAGDVAGKLAEEARNRMDITYRPLAPWYVHRPEPHQRTLPGFQLGGSKNGRSLSVPVAEQPVGGLSVQSDPSWLRRTPDSDI